MSENKIPRKILAPKRIKQLSNLGYCLLYRNQEGLRWAGHVARMEETGNAHRIFVWKPEPLEKGPLKNGEDGRTTFR
jgi:hypothetical protein